MQRRADDLSAGNPGRSTDRGPRAGPDALGLVPYFTKRLSDVKGISTINARAEKVEKKSNLESAP